MNFDDFNPEEYFFSEEVQKSWRIHATAFQPLLDNVFIENYGARIVLTAALNFISNRNFEAGTQRLDDLEKLCTCDEDEAAVLFFRGIICEMQGKEQEMLEWYFQTVDKYSGYYWPYILIAKTKHAKADYITAEKYYLAGIKCFNTATSNMHNSIMLSSMYCNYASCLISMQRYGEAEIALRCSEKILPNAPKRDEIWKVLNSLKGPHDAEIEK